MRALPGRLARVKGNVKGKNTVFLITCIGSFYPVDTVWDFDILEKLGTFQRRDVREDPMVVNCGIYYGMELVKEGSIILKNDEIVGKEYFKGDIDG